MKRYVIFGFLLLAALPSCKTGRDHYDVIVVGGGLAGITAAYNLNQFSVLLLEKEDRLGGRILTKEKQGIPYDLGAVFAYGDSIAPPGARTEPVIEEPDPIGFSFRGRLYQGSSVRDAITRYDPGSAIDSLINSGMVGSIPLKDFEARDGSIPSIIGSFFNLIHPGKPTEYISQRLNDGAARYFTFHRAAGNVELISLYRSGMKATVVTGAEVVEIKDPGDRASVTYVCKGRRKTISAKQVIVATTASRAQSIIRTMTPECRDFLSSVRYGQGYVAVMAIRRPDYPRFSYLVTPDRMTTSVVQFRTGKSDVRLLYVYFMNDRALPLGKMPGEEIIRLSIRELNRAGLPAIETRDIVFTDGKFWKELGTIISPKPYLAFRESMLQPSERIRLAGDYTSWSVRTMIPYGMTPAAESGIKAAQAVKGKLR